MNVRNKGRGGKNHEEGRHESAEKNICGVGHGLVGLDVRRHNDTAEECPNEQSSYFDERYERGPARAGVVNQDSLGDFVISCIFCCFPCQTSEFFFCAAWF